jgi:hypothetical protein
MLSLFLLDHHYFSLYIYCSATNNLLDPNSAASIVVAKRGTMMSAGEVPSASGVNPIPEMRVLGWILSDSDEGPSSGRRRVPTRG